MSDEKTMLIICGVDGTSVLAYRKTADSAAVVRCPTCGQQDTVQAIMSEVAKNYVLIGLGKKMKPKWVVEEK